MKNREHPQIGPYIRVVRHHEEADWLYQHSRSGQRDQIVWESLQIWRL